MNIEKFIETNKENMISDIVEFVNIPTVYCPEESTKEAPFGKAVQQGLEWILNKAASMGMTVKNVDGYAAEISAGRGDFIIGILAHEDVVPAGEDWATDPFDAVVKEGKIYGRGTGDDKGPLISSLYAMKFLMDSQKIPDGVMLRMIVGTDEEEEWRGIDYYTANADVLPNYSIVPDGYFPLIFCEKGLLDFDLVAHNEMDHNAQVIIKALYGGSGRNVVAGKAYCTLETDQPAEVASKLMGEERTSIVVDGNQIKVTVQGKSTHAMSPEKGSNAISLLMDILGRIDQTMSHQSFINRYNQYIGMDYHGGKFGCGFEDELFGKLTLNMGTIKVEEERIFMEANLRYPASMVLEDVKAAMDITLQKAAFAYHEKSYLPPVYIKPDSAFIKRLMESYQRITGDMENQAFTIGGATYARAIPNAVAFGPLFPYEEELAHEANEYLEIESLEKMTLVYTEALQSLMNMKGEMDAR